MGVDLRERAEAIDLRFEDEVWVIKRLREAQEAHRAVGGHEGLA